MIQDRWFPVDVILPNVGEIVLLYGDNMYYKYIVGSLTEHGGWVEDYEGSFIPTPSHWMPLEKPIKDTM